MSIEQHYHPLNNQEINKQDTVINTGVRDTDGRIVPLFNTQPDTPLNPVLSGDNSILYTEKKELPSILKTPIPKEDTVIDVGFRDGDGNIIRLSNNQS